MQKALLGRRNLDSQYLPAMPGVSCVFKDENWDFLLRLHVIGAPPPLPFMSRSELEVSSILVYSRVSSEVTRSYCSLLDCGCCMLCRLAPKPLGFNE